MSSVVSSSTRSGREGGGIAHTDCAGEASRRRLCVTTAPSPAAAQQDHHFSSNPPLCAPHPPIRCKGTAPNAPSTVPARATPAPARPSFCYVPQTTPRASTAACHARDPRQNKRPGRPPPQSNRTKRQKWADARVVSVHKKKKRKGAKIGRPTALATAARSVTHARSEERESQSAAL